MTIWKSVDEVLDFAMAKEEEAVLFYQDLADRADKPWMAGMFKDFAQEEKGHKAKLAAVKEGRGLTPSAAKVLDLKIADYTVDVQAGEDLGFQEALVVAMKREKAAFRLYLDLAESTNDKNLRSTFQALAQEEAKHKLRIEIEYDNRVLSDN